MQPDFSSHSPAHALLIVGTTAASSLRQSEEQSVHPRSQLPATVAVVTQLVTQLRGPRVIDHQIRRLFRGRSLPGYMPCDVAGRRSLVRIVNLRGTSLSGQNPASPRCSAKSSDEGRGPPLSNTYQTKAYRAQPDLQPGEIAVPEQVIVSMAEIAESAKEVLLALAMGTGLQVMGAMFAEDVGQLCGPSARHNAERAGYRHGSDAGSVTLGGCRVPVTRPQVRAVGGPPGSGCMYPADAWARPSLVEITRRGAALPP